MRQHRAHSLVLLLLFLMAVSFPCVVAQAQTSLVQVPFVTNVMGVPSSSDTGTPAGTLCSSTTPGYLGTNTIGNGCPATQFEMQNPYAIATDSEGNVVAAIATYEKSVAVLYQGGATMAALLQAALPAYSFTPMVGHAYFIAGVDTTSALTAQTDGNYHCGNTLTGTVALDAYGDGCPAQYATEMQERAIAIDQDGNIFLGQEAYAIGIRVIYAGGVRAANLIDAYNPEVKASGGPQVGYIYALSTLVPYTTPGNSDFLNIRGLAVVPVSATQENVFAYDINASTAETGLDAATTGAQIKEFVCPVGTVGCNTSVNGMTYNAAGWATYLAGCTTSCTSSGNGDGGPPSGATIGTAAEMTSDQYGDLFFGDTYPSARIRVVYNGGTTLPLFNYKTAVTAPVVGDVYTVAGLGSGTTSPAAANTLSLTGNAAFGLDAAGNLYFQSDNMLWVENASTGQAVDIGFKGVAHALPYSANSSPAAGASCNGSTSPVTGPLMTDAYADGCPATEVGFATIPYGIIPFDPQGNFYMAEIRSTSTASAVVREFSYNNNLGSVAAGTSATASYAFTPATSAATDTPVEALTLSDFKDAGNDVCTSETGVQATQTCVYNVTFAPAYAGARNGALTLTQSGTQIAAIPLEGVGTGAQIALDPSTQSTIGSGLTPGGVAVDSSGNVYIASGTSTGVVLKSAAGGTPTSFATGFESPAQVAVDGSGNVYVADSGNNRIAWVTSAGGTATSFLGGSFSLSNPNTQPATQSSTTLSSPSGVAVDLEGNVYVADTGNNRVIEVVKTAAQAATQNILLNFSGLQKPMGIAVDAAGDVFVADSGNARIVELSASGVQTTVSSGYSPALSQPVGVALDAAGDLYVADPGGQQVVLLPTGATTATTLLESNSGLAGVAADNAGDVYVAASEAGGVTELNRTNTSYSFTGSLPIGSPSAPQSVTLTDTGNESLVLGTPIATSTDATDFSVESTTADGCSAGSVAPGAGCELSLIFNPQSIEAATDSVTFPTSNAVNGATTTLSGQATALGLTYAFGTTGTLPNSINVTLTATVSGASYTPAITGNITFTVDGGTPMNVPISQGVAVATVDLVSGNHTVTASYNNTDTSTVSFTVVSGTSSIQLSSAPSNPTFGQQVVVNAAITNGNSQATPTGTVTFTVNGVQQTPVAYAPSVSLTIPSLPVGTNTVVASYSGDVVYSPATQSITITVTPAPTVVSLQATPSVASGSSTVTLTATVSPVFGVAPSGTVTFSAGGVTLGTEQVASSQATLTVPTSGLTSNTFTATYSGDFNYLGSATSVTPKPIFMTSLASSTLAISQNSEESTTITVTPFFGYSGTVTYSCTGLPEYTVCNPTPSTGVTLSANVAQTVQLQIVTNASPLAVQNAKNETPKQIGRFLVPGGVSLALCLVLPFWKRRRIFTHLLLLFVTLATALTLSSCGSDTASTKVYVSPVGTYTVGVVGTDGTLTTTTDLNMTILAGTSAARQ